MPTAEELLSIIDEKLLALEYQKIELREARNNVLTVNSRLPVELLVEIFRYVVPTKSNGSSINHVCHYRSSACSKWITSIAHVCRHWRTVALSTPSFWIQCTPAHFDGVKAYLDRSAGLPMVPDISFGRMRWDSIKLLLARLPTARGLRIRLEGSPYIPGEKFGSQAVQDAREEFSKHFQTLPQSLEHLTVCGLWNSNNRGDRCAIPFLSADVDEAQFPNLRHLYLSDTLVRWNCGIFRNLRTLVLGSIGYTPGISSDQLLDILAVCPEIEKLGISDLCWADSPVASMATQDLTHLPCLQLACLRIKSPNIVLKLLCRLRLPEEANVWIDTDGHADAPTIQMLFDAALHVLHRARKPLWRLGIACHEGHVGIFGSTINSAGSLCLVMGNWKDKRSLAVQVVDKLLEQDLSCLVALEIHLAGTEAAGEKWWSRLFSRTPKLEVLALRSKHKIKAALKSLKTTSSVSSRKSKLKATAISTTPANSHSSSSVRMRLPHLRELCLWDSDLFKEHHHYYSEQDYNNHATDPNHEIYYLVKYLKAHQGCGLLLQRLKIRAEYTPPKFQHTFLEGLVQQTTFETSAHSRPFGLHSRFLWDWGSEFDA